MEVVGRNKMPAPMISDVGFTGLALSLSPSPSSAATLLDVARPYSQDSSDPYTGELFFSLFFERPRGITRLLDVSGILQCRLGLGALHLASSELTHWMRTELSEEDACHY
jgi:hypothetical protein